MTAVWTQINVVPVKQSHGTDAATPLANQYQLDVRYKSATVVETQVRKAGKLADRFTVEGASASELSSNLNAALRAKLQGWGGTGELISSVMITPREDVSYGDMVLVMDAIRGNGVSNIGVVPVEARYAAR